MISIRPEAPADHRAIHDVHVASFPTAGEADLVDTLRAVGRLCVSLVAVDDDAVVGHVAFSPVTLPGTTDGVGLGPLAVRPTHRRHGIGGQLVRAGLAACENAGDGFVVVLGDPHYYGRFGFEAASARELTGEYGGGDAFQTLELRTGAIPSAGGLVRYAPEFAAVDGAD